MNKSGEFFDLSIASLSNVYGNDKTKYSLKHGIYLPIEKYISELELIGKYSDDDKSEKRKIRLYFLQGCNTSPILQKYFTYMISYLNGSNIGEERSAFDNNKLVIIVAGGNIFGIYARLLVEVYNRDFTSLFNKTLFATQYEFLKQVYYELYRIYNSNIRWRSAFKFCGSAPFSDFDYNLVPNKMEKYEQHFKSYSKLSKAEKNLPGFLLLRVKSFIRDDTLEPSIIPGDLDNCNGILKETNKLFPQGVQERFLLEIEQNKEKNLLKAEMCEKIVKYFLSQKALIAEQTQRTVNSVIATSKDVLNLPGYSDDLTYIMKYLHTVTFNLNIFIDYWERGVLDKSPKRPTIRNMDNESLLNIFNTLNTITDSKVLMELSAVIINAFLNTEPVYHTERFLDIRLSEERVKVAPLYRDKITMRPSRLYSVPSINYNPSSPIHTNLRAILQKVRMSAIGFPDGINIVINAIETNEDEDDDRSDHSKGYQLITDTTDLNNRNLVSSGEMIQLGYKVPHDGIRSPSVSPMASPYNSPFPSYSAGKSKTRKSKTRKSKTRKSKTRKSKKSHIKY